MIEFAEKAARDTKRRPRGALVPNRLRTTAPSTAIVQQLRISARKRLVRHRTRLSLGFRQSDDFLQSW
jgi:hypothetical protein